MGDFLSPEKLENHPSEGKGKKKRKGRGEGKEEKRKKQCFTLSFYIGYLFWKTV